MFGVERRRAGYQTGGRDKIVDAQARAHIRKVNP
jgi:hypothetical protein